MISGWVEGGFSVARTKPLAASKLSAALECPLRYLLETEKLDISSLPKSMTALLGSAIHKVCSDSIGVEVVTPAEVRQRVSDEFERLVKEHSVAGSILVAMNLAVISGNLLSQADFVRRAGIAYKTIQMRQNENRDKGSAIRNIPANAKAQRRYGSEVPLRSDRLDLVGRADLIDKLDDGTIRVIEYKTVRLVDAAEPKEEFWIQAGAYALLATELAPAPAVVLRIVTSDKVWERTLSETFKAEILALLDRVRTKIPRDKPFGSTDIASPGPSCRWCGYRQVCTVYKGWVENRWGAEDGRDLPFDVWGTVTENRGQSDTLTEIRLLDAASRHVRIRNVPMVTVSCEICPGSRIRAFGLMANESGRGSKFPQNFYVADIDRPSFSAFSATILAG